MREVLARCRTMPAALLATTVVCLFVCAGRAHAATYDITSCNPDGSAQGWVAYGTGSSYQSWGVCPSNGDLNNRGIGVANRANAGVLNYSGAGLRFSAPAGTSLVGVGGGVRVQRWDGSYWLGLFAGSGQPLYAFWANDGNGAVASAYTPNSWFTLAHESDVHLEVGCSGGCDTAWLGASGLRAEAQMFDPITVRIEDNNAPNVTLTGGGLVSNPYATGIQTLTYNASDGSGIRATRLYVDGARLHDDARVCSFERPVPCANVNGGSYSLDTRTLTDGAHTVKVETVDSAGNAASQTRSITVDNAAPAAPAVQVTDGEGWRKSKSFDVRWTNPSSQAAPIAEAHYQLCRADQPSSCEAAGVQSGSNISSLSGLTVPGEGDYMLSVWLEDAAGNASAENTSAPVHLRYDASAPAQVRGLAVGGGEGWRTSNSFDLTWDDPDEQLAPIAGVRYRLCDNDGSCSVGDEAAGSHSLSGLAVPAAGDYTLTLWLRDEAGNESESNASAAVHLRFDDTDPGRAMPAEASRWLSAADVADGYDERISLENGSSLAPSGLAGFAVTVDGSTPGTTPDVGPEGLLHIPELAEGKVTVRARAISKSGVASSDVGSAVLSVDKSAPAVTVSGAPDPGAWQSRGVDLILRASDQPELSGMTGGHLTYSVDGGDQRTVGGDSTSVTVTGDGQHTVVYSATDLAGNASGEESLSFKIDGGKPGAAVPESSDGWITASGPYVERIRLGNGEALPASGHAGFSVTTDGSTPDESVDVDADGMFSIEDLPEGLTTVKARAISGAGVASDAVGVGTIKVDRTAPDVELERPSGTAFNARVSDVLSGVQSGVLEFRSVGATGWKPLGTTLDGELLKARQDLAPGSYEVRATATDAAGNRRVVSTLPGGEQATVTVPRQQVPPAAPPPAVATTPAPAAPAPQAAVPARSDVRCAAKPKRPAKHKRHGRRRSAKRRHHSSKHRRKARKVHAKPGCQVGGEKHPHRHLTRKTHKRARKSAG